MKGAVRVDTGKGSEELPSDRLVEHELAELRRLMEEWERLDAAARVAKDRVQLLIMVAKDRRGIVGGIEVKPADGTIVRLEGGING